MLAFDFGSKNFGVAVGERYLFTSRELSPLKAKDGIPDWNVVASLIEEWKPQTILVGLPLNMDGTEQEITRRARKFAQRLRGRFRKTPVELVDERLSTHAAKEVAKCQGHRGDYAKKPIDSIAARLILESWWQTSA